MGCAGINPVHIDPFKIHAPIPFTDGEESVWVDPVTQETGEVDAETWTLTKHEYVNIHINDLSRLLGNLYAACRFAGEKCNVIVRSTEDGVRKLEAVMKQFKGR